MLQISSDSESKVSGLHHYPAPALPRRGNLSGCLEMALAVATNVPALGCLMRAQYCPRTYRRTTPSSRHPSTHWRTRAMHPLSDVVGRQGGFQRLCWSHGR